MSRMQGNINNRGRSSIAALGTPQGRFEKRCRMRSAHGGTTMCGSEVIWSISAPCRIRFYVRSDGKVEDVKVIRNSSNETLASISLQSIIDANLPPMPEDLAPMFSGDPMEFTLSFNFSSE